MRIIRVFPRRTNFTPTDDMAFVGNPPMIRPEADEVHISCTFTWDKPRAEYLAQAWGQYYPVKLGEPAYDDPCNGFTPGMYIKQGVTFTSRGCDNQCPWCLVPKREGKLRPYKDIADGNILQDNNYLQCNLQHRFKVYQMLMCQHDIQFTGGLDSRLLTQEDADMIRSLSVRQMFFACDTKYDLKHLIKAKQLMGDLSRDKLRCYVLLAFNGQTISEAIEHLENVWNAGFMPFAQLYQPPDHLIKYSQEWRDLQRNWQRTAIMKTIHKQEFN